MDRNREQFKYVVQCRKVALRKESVDRNPVGVGCLTMFGGSLSARRAWIEIQVAHQQDGQNDVALRKESVDRNLVVGLLCTFTSLSLSARRAWIEIPITGEAGLPLTGRSPQGERG